MGLEGIVRAPIMLHVGERSGIICFSGESGWPLYMNDKGHYHSYYMDADPYGDLPATRSSATALPVERIGDGPHRHQNRLPQLLRHRHHRIRHSQEGMVSFNHTSKYLLVLASTCYLYQFCYPLLLTEMLFREFGPTQVCRDLKTMPVITFASPKGGAGKTTAALLLSTELAVKGFDVTVIDADPLKWINGWSKLPDKPDKLEVLADLTEDTIIEAIDQAQIRSQFVIIDLEGTASTIVAYAFSRSDFVLVPIQPSNMDARAGAMIVQLIRNHEQAFRIKIPFALFLTKTRAAIRPRTLSNILTQIETAKMPVLRTSSWNAMHSVHYFPLAGHSKH